MTWWYGDNVWTQGRSCWKDTEEWTTLQDLLQQAREATGDDQQNLWNQCFDLLAEQVPLYPLFHRRRCHRLLGGQPRRLRAHLHDRPGLHRHEPEVNRPAVTARYARRMSSGTRPPQRQAGPFVAGARRRWNRRPRSEPAGRKRASDARPVDSGRLHQHLLRLQPGGVGRVLSTGERAAARRPASDSEDTWWSQAARRLGYRGARQRVVLGEHGGGRGVPRRLEPRAGRGAARGGRGARRGGRLHRRQRLRVGREPRPGGGARLRRPRGRRRGALRGGRRRGARRTRRVRARLRRDARQRPCGVPARRGALLHDPRRPPQGAHGAGVRLEPARRALGLLQRRASARSRPHAGAPCSTWPGSASTTSRSTAPTRLRGACARSPSWSCRHGRAARSTLQGVRCGRTLRAERRGRVVDVGRRVPRRPVHRLPVGARHVQLVVVRLRAQRLLRAGFRRTVHRTAICAYPRPFYTVR